MEGSAAKHRLSFQPFFVGEAEDLVLGAGGNDGKIEVLVTSVTVPIAIGGAMSNQKIHV